MQTRLQKFNIKYSLDTLFDWLCVHSISGGWLILTMDGVNDNKVFCHYCVRFFCLYNVLCRFKDLSYYGRLRINVDLLKQGLSWLGNSWFLSFDFFRRGLFLLFGFFCFWSFCSIFWRILSIFFCCGCCFLLVRDWCRFFFLGCGCCFVFLWFRCIFLCRSRNQSSLWNNLGDYLLSWSSDWSRGWG